MHVLPLPIFLNVTILEFFHFLHSETNRMTLRLSPCDNYKYSFKKSGSAYYYPPFFKIPDFSAFLSFSPSRDASNDTKIMSVRSLEELYLKNRLSRNILLPFWKFSICSNFSFSYMSRQIQWDQYEARATIRIALLRNLCLARSSCYH